MTALALPETTVDPALKREVDDLARSFVSIEDAETAALSGDIAAPLRNSHHWSDFCELVASTVRSFGYIVVRGLEADQGRSLLIVSRALGEVFSTYGHERVVKRFRMSPWTEELSHTIREGDFHTDGNVSAVPPVATAMQCEQEDPGAPMFAEQRVASLRDLVERLRTTAPEALQFLTETDTAMARESSPEVWRGRLVRNGTIRYHPQSLRVAQKRLGEDTATIEAVIAAVRDAAFDVSVPFHTAPGDTVLVSNQHALHYRGACSVRFTRFPTEYEARSLFVLHMKDPGAVE